MSVYRKWQTTPYRIRNPNLTDVRMNELAIKRSALIYVVLGASRTTRSLLTNAQSVDGRSRAWRYTLPGFTLDRSLAPSALYARKPCNQPISPATWPSAIRITTS